MRAAVLERFGATPRVVDFDEPAASDGQRVVEVAAAG